MSNSLWRNLPLLLERLVVGISRLMGLLSSMAVLVAVLAVIAQVVTRWIAGSSLAGMTELSRSMLLTSIFMGISWAAIRGEHVSVQLLTSRVPVKVRRLLNVVVWLLSSLFLVWMTLASIAEAIKRTSANQQGFDATIVWLIWPWWWVMVFGLMMIMLVAIINFVRATLGLGLYDDDFSENPTISGDIA